MWRDTSPDLGSLHPAVIRVRLSVLANHTSTSDDCWFCVWDGWGGFVPSQQMPDASPGRVSKARRPQLSRSSSDIQASTC
jgi:hypothetical protein